MFAASVFANSAHADEASPPRGVVELTQLDTAIRSTSGDGGWGFSMVLNVGSLHYDERFDLFGAGLGLGTSWKTKSPVYPLEFGLYFSPSISKAATGQFAVGLATTVHATLFRGFGLGLGFDTWTRAGGFAPNSPYYDGSSATSFLDGFFLTFGYSMFNKTNASTVRKVLDNKFRPYFPED